MLFKDKLHDIIKTIESQKLLLAPVEFGWAICFDPFDNQLYETIHKLDFALDDCLFIMVRDIAMMKLMYPDLHPRLETLLVYHRRPLGILHPNSVGDRLYLKTASCLSFDPYVRRIIDLLDHPMACIFLKDKDKLVSNFKNIHSLITDTVDHVSRHKRAESLGGIKPILVNNDYDGNLIFYE